MEGRYSLAALTRKVQDYFGKHAKKYTLDANSVVARYILNWGGFVNASFHITDGKTSYHLKLADDEDVQGDLGRWQHFNFPLTQQYRAPRMLDWVAIPRSPFAGPLFEYIPGEKADLAAQPAVLQGVLDMLRQLHNDHKLAAALEALDGPPAACGDYFLDVYIDRFDEDLLTVAPNLPPFVSLETLNWMMGETRELEALARDLPAFAHLAASPTHGDLWQNNILVTGTGDWYVIDWDDFALGDPALDYNILLGPLWRQGKRSEEEILALLPNDAALRERFAVCQRALILDQVIDTLADWVEAEFAPDHKTEVQAEKKRLHLEALDQYKSIY